MNKKKIFSLALVALLICTISFGTLAWFNATDEVTNKFYVADSDGDGKPNFSIDVNEKPGSEPGPGGPGGGPGVPGGPGGPGVPGHGSGSSEQLPDGETDDGGHVYKDILPGSKLAKYAYVKNTGEYDQWVRVHLTFSDAAVWTAAIQKAAEAENMSADNYARYKLFTNLFNDNFRDIHFENNGDIFGSDTLTYTFYYTQTLKSGEEFKVLDCIEIPGILVQDDMNFGKEGFSLKIKAEAVQVDNLNAQDAYDAFNNVVKWYSGSEYGA